MLFLARAQAQTAANYIFSTSSGTYTQITGTAANILSDDITQTSIPIGFSFTFCGVPYTQGSVCSNGWFSFSNTSSTSLSNDISTLPTIAPCVMPLWDDLSGSGASAFYTTTGLAPNRVFTMEWRGWRWSFTGALNAISFELKLYETSNIIQCIYSQGSAAATGNGATIGIANSGTDYQTLNNSSAAPSSLSTTFTTNITAKPATGQIYQWSPPLPCTGKPTAGAVTPVTPCANTNFTLSLTGVPIVSGLTYQWQYLSATNVWTNILPGNTQAITYNIAQPTTVRSIVTCTNSGQSDTTAPYLLNIAPFYSCYCTSGATSTTRNIGNVTIQRQPSNIDALNNGVGTPTTNNATAVNNYTNFSSTVAPPNVYRDSLYRIFVTQINQAGNGPTTAAAYIDYNHNGVFDNAELVFLKNITAATNPGNDTFHVPTGALLGVTGMRVILVNGASASISPCGTYTNGETEDYLINITYAPCNGPSNPGTAVATDTVVCPGYTIDLADSTHEKMRSGLVYGWQSSINGGVSWNNVPGSLGKDTLNNVLITGPVQYRLRMRCTFTNDTTYSNVLNITNGANFQCYAISQSTGNRAQDSSDIGVFSIGNYIMPIGQSAGPHLNNPLAVRRHSDFTRQANWIVLNADSTYPVAVYHTMRSPNHGDALISVFMDFNNDLQYSALVNTFPYSPERVFSRVSTAGGYYVSGTITIPNAVVPDVPTGLRVILNNDVNPNSPANLGAGNYVSGETENYVVTFHRTGTSVGTTGLIQDVVLYPNPTDGRTLLGINSSREIRSISIQIKSITGQLVFAQQAEHVGSKYSASLDLSTQARGIYFVEMIADGERITRKLIVR